MAGQHGVIGREAYVPKPQHAAIRCVQFDQAVGEIQRHIKPFAVRRDGEAGGNFRAAARSIRRGQGHREQANDAAALFDAKDLDAAVDIGHVDARAVGREHEAGVTDLGGLVGFEDFRRDRIRRRILILIGRQRDALEDPA